MQRITPFKTLDIFRGFAALWVVMDHSCDRWLASADPKYLHQPLYAFSIRGQLGVIIFFVISGYCITAAAYGALLYGKSIGRYAFERIRRIYPPYLAALVFGVLSLLAISMANVHHWIPPVNHLDTLQSDPRYWIGNILLLQMELNTPMINVVFWSLCYEISFYVIVGIFLFCAQRLSARQGPAAGAMLLLYAMGLSTALTLGWLIVRPAGVFPFDLWHLFSIGGLLFFLLEWKPETVPGYSKALRWAVMANLSVALVLTVLYAVLRETGGEDVGHPSNRVRSITCLLFVALLIALRRFDNAITRYRVMHPLIWAGAFSYSLYLIHPVVLPYVDILCRKVGLNGSRYWIAFWIQVVVATIVGRLFYLLVERRFISKRQVQRLAAEHVV